MRSQCDRRRDQRPTIPSKLPEQRAANKILSENEINLLGNDVLAVSMADESRGPSDTSNVNTIIIINRQSLERDFE